MPKRRVLGYSLDPTAAGDQFLFNLLISPVAIVVNFVASLPGAVRALFAGRLHSRVPATILIALGGLPRERRRRPQPVRRHELLPGREVPRRSCFLLAGFLVSIETFREIRIPFTSIRLGGRADRARPGRRRRAVADPAAPAPRPPAGVAR